MLTRADRLIEALEAAVLKLLAELETQGAYGSAGEAIANAFVLLKTRQKGGLAFLHRQFDELSVIVEVIASEMNDAAALAALRKAIADGRDIGDLDRAEDAWRRAVELCEELPASATMAPASDAARRRLANQMARWECADLAAQASPGAGETTTNEAVTQERLQVYLRDRFNEPRLEVLSLTPLPGGFGKETLIFAVRGDALAGEFVMRRDLGVGLPLANDCHIISKEFAVIKAARARGFPAPEALWLDTTHVLLPGGDFIVMKRAPGTIGGSLFGAAGPTDHALPDTLAAIAARLHALPPLTELGELASFIQSKCWAMTRAQAVRAYIADWFEFVRGSQHTASPALMAIYGWLLDNTPARDGRATLLHGDLGFHNFLFDDGRLSAVLDWEFAHVGDPAEELGYIAVTTAGALDWSRFIARYVSAGGDAVDPKTLHFLKVWAYIRNASAANIQATLLQTGRARELKLAVLPYRHHTHFIREAEALIQAGPDA